MTTTDDNESDAPHVVVINDEEQHALWAAGLAVPAGWSTVFGPASKAECLAYVNEHWTDMRPLSLRRAMERDTQR